MPVIDMDSDGYIEQLIPIWIEILASTLCDPIEVAAHNDIVKYRKMFGKRMAYNGGNRQTGHRRRRDILKRGVLVWFLPLLQEGGFIPGCDHGVRRTFPLANYTEYTRMLAELTGWL